MDVGRLLADNGIFPKSTAPGRHYLTCPKCSAARKLHNQNKRCLSLMIEPDKAYWKCHHCGWTGPEPGSGRFDERERYEYPGGRFKVRNDARSSGPRFTWESENDDGTIKSGGGAGDALYRIEEARERGGLIVVVEGEKDAENLWRFDIPAVTSPHGAAGLGQRPKWIEAHSMQLAGLDIVVLNDNDQPGYEHAKAVVSCSLGYAKSIRRLDLADHWPGGKMPEGADVSDFIIEIANHEDFVQQLLDLLHNAPLINGEDASAKTAENDAKTAENRAENAENAWFVDIALDAQMVPDQEWSVPGRIPARNTCLFTGHGAAGKSTIGLHLCAAHALGQEWLGSFPEQGPAFFIDAEDEFNVIWRRLEAIRKHYGTSYQALIAGGLMIKTMAGQDAVMAVADRNGKMLATPFYRELLAQAIALKPVQIVIASAANVFAGNENDRSQVQQFHQMLMHLAICTAGSVTLIAHPSRVGMTDNGGGYSGSTQWHNAFRSRFFIEADKEAESAGLRKITFLKNQYGPEDENLTLRWKDGMFLADAKPGSYEAAAREAAVDSKIIELMKVYAARHQPLSPLRFSQNYLPTLFAREPDAKGIRKAEFVAGLDRLLAKGRLVVKEWGPPSKRYTYVELAE